MGQKRVKNVFFQSEFGPFGMLKKSVFSPFGAHLDGFWPMEIPIFLEKGPFREQKLVKLVENAFFQT